MSFTNLSPLAFGLGLLGVAGVLFLLQRLRVRHRPHEVVTTLFWKQAVEEARARVLVRRFRHLPAYLLALLIAGLAWLGFADPEPEGAGDRDYVVLLDGSSAMAEGDRFARAIDAVEECAAGLPRKHRRVVLCSSAPGTMLQPGEHLRLLRTRLGRAVAAPCPPSVDAVCAAWAFARPTTVYICGEAVPTQATLDGLPDDVQVERVAIDAPARGVPTGIRALGFGRASSGSWEAVDVLCTIDSDDVPEVRFALDGKTIDATAKSIRSGRQTHLELTDLPARGGLLEATLVGAPPAYHGRAQLQLPDHRPIRVSVAPSVAATFASVLGADPAISLVTEQPDVSIRRSEDPAPGSAVPEIVLVPQQTQSESFLIQHPAGEDSHSVLRSSLTKLRLTEIDATSMAETSGTAISLGAAPASSRGIRIWDALLGEEFHFVDSRAFPVFVAQSVRWLVGLEPTATFALAGHPVSGDTARRRVASVDAGATDGTWLDPVGAAFVPPAGGVFETSDGSRLGVLNPLPPPPPDTPTGLPPTTATALATRDWSAIIAGLLVTLILIEWFLVRTGRMP